MHTPIHHTYIHTYHHYNPPRPIRELSFSIINFLILSITLPIHTSAALPFDVSLLSVCLSLSSASVFLTTLHTTRPPSYILGTKPTTYLIPCCWLWYPFYSYFVSIVIGSFLCCLSVCLSCLILRFTSWSIFDVVHVLSVFHRTCQVVTATVIVVPGSNPDCLCIYLSIYLPWSCLCS